MFQTIKFYNGKVNHIWVFGIIFNPLLSITSTILRAPLLLLSPKLATHVRISSSFADSLSC